MKRPEQMICRSLVTWQTKVLMWSHEERWRERALDLLRHALNPESPAQNMGIFVLAQKMLLHQEHFVHFALNDLGVERDRFIETIEEAKESFPEYAYEADYEEALSYLDNVIAIAKKPSFLRRLWRFALSSAGRRFERRVIRFDSSTDRFLESFVRRTDELAYEAQLRDARQRKPAA